MPLPGLSFGPGAVLPLMIRTRATCSVVNNTPRNESPPSVGVHGLPDAHGALKMPREFRYGEPQGAERIEGGGIGRVESGDALLDEGYVGSDIHWHRRGRVRIADRRLGQPVSQSSKRRSASVLEDDEWGRRSGAAGGSPTIPVDLTVAGSRRTTIALVGIAESGAK